MPRRSYRVYGAPLPGPDKSAIRIIGPLPGKGAFRVSWLFILGGLGLTGFVVWMLARKGDVIDYPEDVPGPALGPVVPPSTSGPAPRQIVYRQRADGVDGRLQAFLDDWSRNGLFDIGIGMDGGVRTDALKQMNYFLAGKSKAKFLSETPHGRGGAVDVYPIINGKWRGATTADGNLPEVRALFKQIADFAKSRHGLKWGGDFTSFYDGPHLEVPDWKKLPMPGLFA